MTKHLTDIKVYDILYSDERRFELKNTMTPIKIDDKKVLVAHSKDTRIPQSQTVSMALNLFYVASGWLPIEGIPVEDRERVQKFITELSGGVK